ncbi:hypothetical protein Rsub_07522 [Raphidocelis subcapitata]|uniref:Uncharacterized protein n=1 Tax=Raphidocelis subcapitata TaxID=307507 RepID=A0A2V0P563_9CHLO|nr:hypothetical protein Rsub_07522 [Raphidocelis subcapitata]|eukprot:GBF95021.1 hypothetical protein Rsub_07522 [Raphidocelis subcapitata]
MERRGDARRRGAALACVAALLCIICGAAAGAAPPPPRFPPPYAVVAFHYLWYGEPATDGRYLHWDHELIPHWKAGQRDKWPTGKKFTPPGSVHSPFYPQHGPYSSRDPLLIQRQVEQLLAAGIGTIAASWWGPAWRTNTTDTQGVSTDKALGQLIAHLEAAAPPLLPESGASNSSSNGTSSSSSGGGAEGGSAAAAPPSSAAPSSVRLAFHLEPYPGRTTASVREDLADLTGRFGRSGALLRLEPGGRPVYFVYDSYRIPAAEWAELLTPGGASTVRGTDLDGIFLGLVLSFKDTADIEAGGFDGFYTYFASEAVSPASNPSSWRGLGEWAAANGKLFVPSVGPGYNDTKIRPWNAVATRDRDGGARYTRNWDAAAAAAPDAVSIVSWNEWGEGSQIEPAEPAADPATGEASLDYGPGGPRLYLELTAAASASFRTGLALRQSEAGAQQSGAERRRPASAAQRAAAAAAAVAAAGAAAGGELAAAAAGGGEGAGEEGEAGESEDEETCPAGEEDDSGEERGREEL